MFFSHISEGHTARYVSITKKLAVSFKKKKKLAVPLHLYVVIYMATMFLALLLLTFE